MTAWNVFAQFAHPDGPSLMCAAGTLAKDAYRGQSMVRPDDAFDETPVYALV